MRFETSTDVRAAPSRIFEVLCDVSTWPTWTSSMTSIEPLDGEGFEVGQRFRIRQPGLPPAVWTIDLVESPRRFAWSTRRPGLKIWADHRIEPQDGGTSCVTLEIAVTGALGRVVAATSAARIRRAVETERDGLKSRSEISLM
jgi:hypothetical protein